MSTVDHSALLSRIEQAGLNASATPHQHWLDGWLIRHAAGTAKRSRCINAVAEGKLSLADKLERSNRIYRDAGLPLVIRITPFSQPATLDEDLASLGWGAFDDTVVMWMQLQPLALQQAPEGLLSIEASGAAFAAVIGSFRGSSLAEQQAHAERLAAAPVPHRGVVLCRASDAEPLVCGQAAVEYGLAGLYDVHTSATSRREGLGRRICEHLLSSAAAAGARFAYLQVESDNLAARGLYRSLGFVDGYRYHYRAPSQGPFRQQPDTDRPLIRHRQASPAASSAPRCRFIDCTAAPLAPLPRLSSRAISSTCAP